MTNNNSASGGKKSFQNAKRIGLKFEEGILSFQEQKLWSPMQNPIHSKLNYFLQFRFEVLFVQIILI